jgi:predicted chitinase
MVEITRPGAPKLPGSRAGIDVGLVTNLGVQGTSAIGSAVSQAGRRFGQTNVASISASLQRLIDAQNTNFLQPKKNAVSPGLYSNAMNKFKLGMAEFVDGRTANMYDQDGNPTHYTLTSDIREHARGLSEQIGGAILDEGTREKFMANSLTHSTGLELNSLGLARKFDIDYNVSNTKKYIEDVTNAGVNTNNFLEIPEVLGEIQDVLREGSDYFSPLERQTIFEDARHNLYKNILQNTAVGDPESAIQIIENTPLEDLHISEQERINITNTAKNAMARAESENEKVLNIKQEFDKEAEKQRMFEYDLQLEMKAEHPNGPLNIDILNKDLEDGKLSIDNYRKYVKKTAKVELKEIEQLRLNKQISHNIENNLGLGDFTPEQIEDHFNNTLTYHKEEDGNPPNIMKQAQIATLYKAPLKSFTNKLEGLIRDGDPEQANEAIIATSLLMSKNPNAIEKLGEKERSVVNYVAAVGGLNNAVGDKYAISSTKLIDKAREVVYNMDEDTKKQFAKDFKNLTKDEDVFKKTLDTALGFDTKDVPAPLREELRSLMSMEYQRTGQLGAAQKFVNDTVGRHMGKSILSGDRVMLLPPEKLFPGTNPQVFEDMLLQNLNESVDRTELVEQFGEDFKISITPNTSSFNTGGFTGYHIMATKEVEFGGKTVKVTEPVYTKDGQRANFVITQKEIQQFQLFSNHREAYKKATEKAISGKLESIQEEFDKELLPSKIEKAITQAEKQKVRESFDGPGFDIVPEFLLPSGKGSLSDVEVAKIVEEVTDGHVKLTQEDVADITDNIINETSSISEVANKVVTTIEEEFPNAVKNIKNMLTIAGGGKPVEEEYEQLLSSWEKQNNKKAKEQKDLEAQIDERVRPLEERQDFERREFKAPKRDKRQFMNYNSTGIGNAFDAIAVRADPKIREVLITGTQTLEKYGINNPTRLRMFLAQMGHESQHFQRLKENRSDASAERKYGMYTSVGKKLGNTQPGDGAKFKGRGIIQLTGRYNYTHYGKALGIDLINNPELAADPKVALEIAAMYWKDKGLNELADQGNFREITRRINGGYNGYDDRLNKLRKLQGIDL